MASTYIDSSLLQVFMTSTGYIALCSNHLDDTDEAKIFGSQGAHPPRPVSELIDEMLADMSAVPTENDLRDLTELKHSLEYSLERVKAALARR